MNNNVIFGGSWAWLSPMLPAAEEQAADPEPETIIAEPKQGMTLFWKPIVIGETEEEK